MAVTIKVRNYAGLCLVEYYMAFQKALLLYADILSIMQVVNENGTGRQ